MGDISRSNFPGVLFTIDNFSYFLVIYSIRNKISDSPSSCIARKEIYIYIYDAVTGNNLQRAFWSIYKWRSPRHGNIGRVEVVTRPFLKINRFDFSAQAQLWKSVNLKWRKLEHPCHFSILLSPTHKPWISISPPSGSEFTYFSLFFSSPVLFPFYDGTRVFLRYCERGEKFLGSVSSRWTISTIRVDF